MFWPPRRLIIRVVVVFIDGIFVEFYFSFRFIIFICFVFSFYVWLYTVLYLERQNLGVYVFALFVLEKSIFLFLCSWMVFAVRPDRYRLFLL